MNAVGPRRDERINPGQGSDRKNRKNVSDDGWSTATSRNSRTGFSVQSDKLKNKTVSLSLV